MEDFSVAIIISVAVYAVFVTFVSLGWLRALVLAKKHEESATEIPSVSMIIPFRNEAARLMPLVVSVKILSQKFPASEFIFVDDHSDDGAEALLQAEFSGFEKVRYLHLPPGKTGKKAAITHGILVAENEYVITTDADCEPTETAFADMAKALSVLDTQMVCGSVVQYSGKGLGAALADLEFLAMVGSGISFWGWGIPFMANGAFLGLRKKAFLLVEGYKGNEEYPGGDDVFLLQKIRKKYGTGSVSFLNAKADMVQTKGDSSFREFVGRRIRWGAKAKAYIGVAPKVVTLYIFLANLLLLVSFFACLFSADWQGFLFLSAAKITCDVIMLSLFIRRFGQWRLWAYVIAASVLHPPYIIVTGILSLNGRYQWKKRKYGT